MSSALPARSASNSAIPLKFSMNDPGQLILCGVPGKELTAADAELAAEAIDAGFAGLAALEAALADYERKRNAASKPLYDLTLDIASMKPFSPVQVELMRALKHNPAALTQFYGVLTGAVKPTEFFTPQNLLQILKVKGIARITLGRIFPIPHERAV